MFANWHLVENGSKINFLTFHFVELTFSIFSDKLKKAIKLVLLFVKGTKTQLV